MTGTGDNWDKPDYLLSLVFAGMLIVVVVVGVLTGETRNRCIRSQERTSLSLSTVASQVHSSSSSIRKTSKRLEVSQVILAKKVSSQRWVSIADRYPERGIWVLGHWIDEEKTFICRRLSFKRWQTEIGYEDVGPTHWMPMPLPPDDLP